MNLGTYPLRASMINNLNRIDNISNNLANSNTNGYKEENLKTGSFNNYLEKELKKGNNEINNYSKIVNEIPKQNEKYINQEKGNIIQTGNRLDFSLKENDTFFVTQDKNENILFTRDGSFKINTEGLLVDSNGNNILNSNFEQIDTTEEDFKFQIGVIKTDYNNLNKVGLNNYNMKNKDDFEIIEDYTNSLEQGTLETSNVNSVHTMVRLIEAQRDFERSQKGIKTIDEINQKVIEKLGDNK